MSFYVALVGWLVVTAGVVGVRAWTSPRRRLRRLMARASDTSLAALAEGAHVRVRGVALRATATLIAPMTRRRCLGWLLLVEQHEDGAWSVAQREHECASFDLAADGLVARVEGPLLLDLPPDAANGDCEAPLPEKDLEALGGLGIPTKGRWLRWSEAVLGERGEIIVAGVASVHVDPRGRRDSPRDQPLTRVIRGTAEEPVVVAEVPKALARSG